MPSAETASIKDPLGKPLVPSTLTPTQERDPGIVVDAQGNAYIIFGVWDFYLARLNPDMISLAEAPRKIELDQKNGPYGPGKTDDKPFLHERDGKFYLSWGCYYAMSDNVYGPYVYKGSVIVKDRVAPEFQKALTYDRHGSFFELHHQWYFICNDQSWPGTQAHFRDSVISYIHYRDNGEIEPVYLDRVGVGRYDASQSRIEAENYFKASDMTQSQCAEGGFEMRDIHEGSSLEFPHVMHVPAGRPLSFRVASGNPRGGTIEVRADGPKGKLLGKCRVPNTGSWTAYQTIACKINDKSDDRDLYLLFRGGSGELLRLNWLSFIENKPSTAGVLEPDTR
jgi:arabinoxylan arabinofuranohydrolase